MKYLLDTHTLIWFGEGNDKLPIRIRELILDPSNLIFISHASIWEMTIKVSLGKLVLEHALTDWEELLAKNHISTIVSAFSHFDVLKSLPYHHNDPFDRMIIAQAISEEFTIITHDSKFQLYTAKLEYF